MKREELEEQLRPLIFSCPDSAQDGCPFSGCTSCDERMAKAMALVDEYVATQEMWPADKVAAYMGLPTHHQARTVMSRARIPGVSGRHPVTGKRAALYPADQVRLLQKERVRKSSKKKGSTK